MKSRDYWNKRAEQVATRQYLRADQYIESISSEYAKASQSIQRDIMAFYEKYAVNNEISLSDARKLLSSGELKGFKLSVDEFIDLAKNNPDGRWTQVLNNAYYKTRISRLEALQIQTEAAIQNLNVNFNNGMTNLLSNTYTDTYYRTLYEIQKGNGIGVSFANLDTKTVESIVKTPWLEQNYSQRIWGDNAKLVRNLQTELTQAIIRGDDGRKTTRLIAERMGVGLRNAERLVRTEASHIQNEATFAGYRSSGVVEKYEYLATLDSKTTDICQDMDGQVFPLAQKEVGVNYPPLHPNCRSTVAPYFDDEIVSSERIARDFKTGETYYVPSDMSYKDWYQKHVVEKYGQEEADRLQKMMKNEHSDRKQHAKYMEILGKDIPKSFDKFQDLKYNKTEEWNSLKGDYRKVNAYNRIIENEPAITKDLKEIAQKTGTDMAGLEYRLKAKESYLRKVNMESKNSLDIKVIDKTISTTNDVIRYTYQADYGSLVDRYTEINKELLEKGYQQTKVKNTWLIKGNPYKGINCNYHSPSGQGFEIQYHTPESFMLKNGELHSLYEQWRSLENKGSVEAVELSKKMADLSSKLKYPDKIDTVR